MSHFETSLPARMPGLGRGGPRPAIAIACSGLGHVQRGIEAWATGLASALSRCGVNANLFSGGHVDGAVALLCVRRTSRSAAFLAGAFHYFGGWRYGVGSRYEVEQTTFALQLWRHIGGNFDILHVQDPLVGSIFSRLRRMGMSRPRVIFGNGTE